MPFLYKFSLVLVLSAHGVDLATTEHCLGAGRCRELNPWLGRFEQPIVFGAAKMGVASGGLWAVDKLHEKHPKLAILVNVAIAGAYTGIALHNARVTR